MKRGVVGDTITLKLKMESAIYEDHTITLYYPDGSTAGQKITFLGATAYNYDSVTYDTFQDVSIKLESVGRSPIKYRVTSPYTQRYDEGVIVVEAYKDNSNADLQIVNNKFGGKYSPFTYGAQYTCIVIDVPSTSSRYYNKWVRVSDIADGASNLYLGVYDSAFGNLVQGVIPSGSYIQFTMNHVGTYYFWLADAGGYYSSDAGTSDYNDRLPVFTFETGEVQTLPVSRVYVNTYSPVGQIHHDGSPPQSFNLTLHYNDAPNGGALVYPYGSSTADFTPNPLFGFTLYDFTCSWNPTTGDAVVTGHSDRYITGAACQFGLQYGNPSAIPYIANPNVGTYPPDQDTPVNWKPPVTVQYDN